jgi:hypothetical protein
MASKLSGAVAVAVSAFVVCSSAVGAQTCVGQLSLSKVGVNVSANMPMVSQGRGYEGRAGFGNARTFGSASAGTVLYDRGEQMQSFIAGLEGGYALTRDETGPSLCAVVATNYENGPDNVVVSRTTLRGFAGLSVGGAAKLSEKVTLVSFFGGGANRTQFRSKFRDNAVSNKTTWHTGQVMGGLGLQFNQQYLVRVSAYLPGAVGEYGGEAPGYFVVGFTLAPAPVR